MEVKINTPDRSVIASFSTPYGATGNIWHYPYKERYAVSFSSDLIINVHDTYEYAEETLRKLAECCKNPTPTECVTTRKYSSTEIKEIGTLIFLKFKYDYGVCVCVDGVNAAVLCRSYLSNARNFYTRTVDLTLQNLHEGL